jgi:hypothetical protein
MLHFTSQRLDAAKDAFRKAREFSKYNFEYRLSFRLHMALAELSRENKKGGEEKEEVEVEEESEAVEEKQTPAKQTKKNKKNKKKKEKKRKDKKKK